MRSSRLVAIAAFNGGNPDLLYRRGLSRHALAEIDGALADWRAHLTAYGPGNTSPYAEEIKLRAGDLVAGAEAPENVAGHRTG